MQIEYSIVQNSLGKGLNVLVMRAWYMDEESGEQVTIKSEVKSGISIEECFVLAKSFVESTKEVSE